MLKMKSKCEKCSEALPHQAVAYICSYECTFCTGCTEQMKRICPNCEGELVRRPVRSRGVVDVATSQIKRRLTGG